MLTLGSDALKIISFNTIYMYVKLLCHSLLKACNKIGYLKFFILFLFYYFYFFIFFILFNFSFCLATCSSVCDQYVDRCHCRKVWITFDIREIGVGFLW